MSQVITRTLSQNVVLVSNNSAIFITFAICIFFIILNTKKNIAKVQWLLSSICALSNWYQSRCFCMRLTCGIVFTHDWFNVGYSFLKLARHVGHLGILQGSQPLYPNESTGGQTDSARDPTSYLLYGSIPPQVCPVGLRSGNFTGCSILVMPSCRIKIVTILARWRTITVLITNVILDMPHIYSSALYSIRTGAGLIA